jgi:protein-S-isoprenylcysteine O-methyltransferase Ste14
MLPVIRKINQVGYERLLPAILWLVFAYGGFIRLQGALAEQNWLLSAREIGNLTFTLLVVILFMVRFSTKGKRAKPVEAVVAVAGTLAPIVFAVIPVRHSHPAVLITGNIIGILGVIWAILSVATLGRCFGLFPEARGLVTSGPYKYIRHPLYLGEIIIMIGILLPVFTPLSFLTWIIATYLQIWRASNEEKVLESEFPEYASYKMRTRRLIPYLW